MQNENPRDSYSEQRVTVRNESRSPLPEYKTSHAAGMDISAFLRQPVSLAPGERKLIGTGIYMALPSGFEAQIRSRSGLAYHNGIIVLNSPGTIDADYRGEIKVLLINVSDQVFIIQDGDRIAQLVVVPYTRVAWLPTKVLPDSSRGAKGFGSTGVR
ncbi:MAG: dUTP diphosphatase [Bacteroidota bacterium]